MDVFGHVLLLSHRVGARRSDHRASPLTASKIRMSHNPQPGNGTNRHVTVIQRDQNKLGRLIQKMGAVLPLAVARIPQNNVSAVLTNISNTSRTLRCRRRSMSSTFSTQPASLASDILPRLAALIANWNPCRGIDVTRSHDHGGKKGFCCTTARVAGMSFFCLFGGGGCILYSCFPFF